MTPTTPLMRHESRIGSLFLTVVCLVWLLILPAGAALSADLGRGSLKDPPPQAAYGTAPPTIWTGLYWGVSLGYGWGESEHYYDRGNNHGTETLDLEGGLASLTAGYNYQVAPGFVLGLEGDVGVMDLSATDKIIFDGHIWKSGFGALWGTARVRAGVLLGATLLYGTGGWAFMEVNEVGIGDAAGQTATNESFRSGWVVGGGIEHAFAPGVSAKVEYLHMDFGRYNGYSENREKYYFDNTVDLVRVGLNFRF